MNAHNFIQRDDEETLGQRIKRARLSRGWTLDKLASEVGVSRVSVWGWEHDRSSPRLEMLAKISSAFGLTTQALLEGDQFSAPQVADLIADCQRRIANAVGVQAEAVEIKISFGGTEG